MPEALISRITSPGPGVGSGKSRSSTFRPPGKTTPFIAQLSLDHALVGHSAAIHLVIEPLHRRTAEMPTQSGARGATTHDLVTEEGMQVIDRVHLRRGRVFP